MKIFCVACDKKVDARFTTGAEIYPHRKDLHNLPFWICDTCKNYVGCHHKSSDPTQPKGSIPSEEVRRWRIRIHQKIDPLWMSHPNRGKRRQRVYSLMSLELGYTFHSGEIKTEHMFECSVHAANRVAKRLKKEDKGR